MKERFLRELENEGYLTHGCVRVLSGDCCYIASKHSAADLGRRQGRQFIAFRENTVGQLEVVGNLSYFVSGTLAAIWQQQSLGDREEFVIKGGLAKLRNLLVAGAADGFEEEFLLTTQSPENEFRPPQDLNPITEQKKLRDEILRILAVLHSEGHKRVSRDRLLEQLCADPTWINRQLNILSDSQLVDGVPRGEMKLTAKGHLAAEATFDNEQNSERADNISREFDLFFSYASEDRNIVEALVANLGQREVGGRPITVWWDRGQIRLGDSLTKKIEEGLARSRYGVVVISRSFVDKQWPEAELRALASRAIKTGERVVLPVLIELTHEELAEAYPLLSDIVSTQYHGDIDALSTEIAEAIV